MMTRFTACPHPCSEPGRARPELQKEATQHSEALLRGPDETVVSTE